MGDAELHGIGRLALDPERMRELGYRTVDFLVDALTAEEPPLRRADATELRARLAGPAPEEGEPYEAALERLARDVLPYRSRGEHPGFLAFIPFAGTWPGALGDFVASACNIYAGSWMEGAGAAAVELQVLDWFRDWVGYPETAAGALVSGGSVANLTALACARETLAGSMPDGLVGYVGDQAHSSIARAARVLGFRQDQLRVLPSSGEHRLAPETVSAAIDADLRAGRRPLFVAASAGSTNTGAVDPLRELAELCRKRGVWLHVDAAYGGFAALTERGRALLDGIELADSITLDPHKWLYQPYECGCVLVREGAQLEHAFAIAPHYLDDARADDGEVNFSDRGLQLTRSARALKVWLSVRTFGLGAFRETIDRTLDLAEHARRRVAESDRLELVGGSLGVVCLYRRVDGADDEEVERVNAGLIAAVERSGAGLVSSTRLEGRFAVRLCILGHATTQADVDRVLDVLELGDPEPVEGTAAYERDPDLTDLRSTVADAVATMGSLRAVAAGDVLVAENEHSHEFYVVLEGEVEVLVDGAQVSRLGEGDFFGELAALDWGGGFGYPRMATVVASTSALLRVVPAERLRQLVADRPDVDAAIRAAVRERLPRRRGR